MNLKYTPKAKEDLLRIRESIIEDFEDEEISKKVLREITKTARNLTAFPYMGKKVSEFTDVFTKYRVIFCKKNYIFYRIEDDTILVIRILNEKQDYMQILFGISEVEEADDEG